MISVEITWLDDRRAFYSALSAREVDGNLRVVTADGVLYIPMHNIRSYTARKRPA